MTRLSVVSALTNLGGVGSVDLGDRDLDGTTIGDVREIIAERFEDDVVGRDVKFWWRGYVLDDDSLPIRKACVGVNREDVVAKDTESLVLFLTIEETPSKKLPEAPSSPISRLRRIPSLF